MITGYQGQFNPALSVVIANGATESGAITTGGQCLCGVLMPAAFTGTAITFEASSAVDGTYVPVYGSAGASVLSYVVGTSRYIAIDPKDFQGIEFLKIKSGSAEGAARTLVCSMKGIA